MEISPWRKGTMITAGLFGQWMRIQFIGLRVRDAYDAKSERFGDVVPRAGSAFAVVKPPKSRQSPSPPWQFSFVMLRPIKTPRSGEAACV